MNLFYLDDNFEKCAEYHVDKHIVKMPLEVAQLLCTAIWVDEHLGFIPRRKTTNSILANDVQSSLHNMGTFIS
jgi:hypothetical protein